MKRRNFLKASAAGIGLTGASLGDSAPKNSSQDTKALKAGFGRAKINCALGMKLMGWANRDCKEPCAGIHDDIYVRALYLEQGDEQVLLMGFDLCLIGRDQADRFKSAIGRQFDMCARQILMNTSHSHVSPYAGTWWNGHYEAVDWDYQNVLEDGVIEAVRQARQAAQEVTLWAAKGRTTLPVCRRKPRGDGTVDWAPYPEGITYNEVPICLFKDKSGGPVCLLFSASTHPSFKDGNRVSAEWPGAAIRHLDRHFGRNVSLFLQGVAGDSKACIMGNWKGDWEQMDKCGRLVADDALKGMAGGLTQIQPQLISRTFMTYWPLQSVEKSQFETVVQETEPEKDKDPVVAGTRYRWAKNQLKLIARGRLATTAPLLAHGIKIADGLRIFALEGEPVAEWGHVIESFYGKDHGVTFPLGYSNGQGLYLPVSRQISERGYEVDSYWEYGFPAPLAEGMEEVVLNALSELRKQGIT